MTPEGKRELERDEGREPAAYPDPRSRLGEACAARHLPMRDYRKVPGWATLTAAPWTIGVGCTGAEIRQDTVWTEAKIDSERDRRIAGFEAEVDAAFPWAAGLDAVRHDVLTMLAFNLGTAGLKKWPMTMSSVKLGHYSEAADEIMANKVWCAQVGAGRSGRLASAMRLGRWGG